MIDWKRVPYKRITIEADGKTSVSTFAASKATMDTEDIEDAIIALAEATSRKQKVSFTEALVLIEKRYPGVVREYLANK